MTNAIFPHDIIRFLFDELQPAQWWTASDDLDHLITARFGAVHQAAALCELFAWRDDARGRLAEIIVLDQFSRNIHRGTPLAFASDPMALALAQTAVASGADLALDVQMRAFVYLPYMHSESLVIHGQAIPLFNTPGMENNLKSARLHREILERFGRYPHRNAILGRGSTLEEIAFLKIPGSSF
jgi:uncharacterized protein (DUF924 family)